MRYILLTLTLMFGLCSFSQEWHKLSEDELDYEMEIAEIDIPEGDFWGPDENRSEKLKLVRKELSEKGRPIDGEGYWVMWQDETMEFPMKLYYVKSFQEEDEEYELLNQIAKPENNAKLWKFDEKDFVINENLTIDKELAISIIFSFLGLFIISRKTNFCLKIPFFFIAPFLSWYSLHRFYELYMDDTGIILYLLILAIIFIFTFWQAFKESPLGATVGLLWGIFDSKK